MALCCAVAFASTALLFFLRLRAIYNQNRVVVITFLVLWILFTAGTICSVFFVDYSELDPLPASGYCDSTANTFPVFIELIATLVYDTLVFVAISWRLCRISCIRPSGPQESLKLLIFGKYLPAFTKSLYLDGQIYYL